MSDGQHPQDLDTGTDLLPGEARGGRRRAEKQRRSGCLPMLIGVIVFVALVGALAKWVILPGWDRFFAEAEDYPGPGTGEVVFVIDPGQSVSSMASELVDLNVVASTEAFV